MKPFAIFLLFAFSTSQQLTGQSVMTMDIVQLIPGAEEAAHFYYQHNWLSFRVKARSEGWIKDFSWREHEEDGIKHYTLMTTYRDSAQWHAIEDHFSLWREGHPLVLMDERKPGDIRQPVASYVTREITSGDGVKPPVSKACESAERRAFDFWVGDWVVHRPDGKLAGHNRITRIEGGCALREEWRSANGNYTGSSYNAFNQATGKWHQTWVDNQGGVLQLSGGLDGHDMVLTSAGHASPGEDAKLDRIRWTPLPDGRVRQLWEKSENGGAEWRTVFDGYYSRR